MMGERVTLTLILDPDNRDWAVITTGGVQHTFMNHATGNCSMYVMAAKYLEELTGGAVQFVCKDTRTYNQILRNIAKENER